MSISMHLLRGSLTHPERRLELPSRCAVGRVSVRRGWCLGAAAPTGQRGCWGVLGASWGVRPSVVVTRSLLPVCRGVDGPMDRATGTRCRCSRGREALGGVTDTPAWLGVLGVLGVPCAPRWPQFGTPEGGEAAHRTRRIQNAVRPAGRRIAHAICIQERADSHHIYVSMIAQEFRDRCDRNRSCRRTGWDEVNKSATGLLAVLLGEKELDRAILALVTRGWVSFEPVLRIPTSDSGTAPYTRRSSYAGARACPDACRPMPARCPPRRT